MLSPIETPIEAPHEKESSRDKIKIVKSAILAALLVGAGYFFGHIVQQISQQYHLLLSPSMETLNLAWWFLGALAAVAVMAGLAAVLLRPFWTCVFAFALSALAMLLAYGVGSLGAALAVIYFIAGLAYSGGIAGELNNRLNFSTRPIFENQTILILVLSLVACVSFYSGYAEEVQREGFTLPSGIVDLVMRASQGHLNGAGGGLELDVLREQIKQQGESMVEPWEQFIPLILSALLFMTMTTVLSLLSWIPVLFLAILFPLLKLSRVIQEVTETREAKRLAI